MRKDVWETKFNTHNCFNMSIKYPRLGKVRWDYKTELIGFAVSSDCTVTRYPNKSDNKAAWLR